MSGTLGFVGLGAMGLPMARRLLGAGHDVTVHNRSEPPILRLEAHGATRADTPADVAARSDVIFTMLPTEEALLDVALGSDGLHAGARPRQVLVDSSTVSPATVSAVAAGLAAHDVAMVDAPVSGGVQGAIDGTLSVMVGGFDESVDRVLPFLKVFGSAVVHVGHLGAGQTVKAANQILVAGIIQALSEAIVLLDATGTDAVAGLEAISHGLGANRLLDLKKASLLARDFEPGGRAELHRKDLRIALDIGRRHRVYLPLAAAVDQLFTALAARGMGERDHTALLGLQDEFSGRGG